MHLMSSILVVSENYYCFKTTPLTIAINENKVDIVEFLLKNGADPNLGFNF